MEECCSNHERSNAGGGEKWLDPTMSECCIREAIEQRKIENVKARLRAVDVSMKALDIRHQVFPSIDANDDNWLDTSEGEDSDDDPVLKEIRDRRTQELEERARSKNPSSICTVATLSCPNALEGKLRSDDTPTIVHIAVPSSEVSCQFDELLDRLAFKHSKMRCLRLVHGGQLSIPSLRLDQKEPPAVACFRNGCLVGKASLAAFSSEGDFLEEKAIRFLRQLRILKKLGDKGQGSECSTPSSCDDNEDPWLEDPCAVCGRTYPHKHFGPAEISTDGLGDTDADSGEEE